MANLGAATTLLLRVEGWWLGWGCVQHKGRTSEFHRLEASVLEPAAAAAAAFTVMAAWQGTVRDEENENRETGGLGDGCAAAANQGKPRRAPGFQARSPSVCVLPLPSPTDCANAPLPTLPTFAVAYATSDVYLTARSALACDLPMLGLRSSCVLVFNSTLALHGGTATAGVLLHACAHQMAHLAHALTFTVPY